MDIRGYLKEHGIKHDERGVALFMSMMFIVLLSALSLLMFQNASLERMIAGYTQQDVTNRALAESGFEQTLSWFSDPTNSPDQAFFGDRLDEGREFSNVSLGDVGKIKTVSLASLGTARYTVRVTAENGRGVQADIGRNPMPKITAAVQGVEEAPHLEKIVVSNDDFSEAIRFVSLDKEKTLDIVDQGKLKRFIRRYGRYVTVSDDGCLQEQGSPSQECQTFKTLFSKDTDENTGEVKNEEKGYDLVFIDTEHAVHDVTLSPGVYKGYFYFKGDITVKGDVANGQTVNVTSLSQEGRTISTEMHDIHLDGLLYTHGTIKMDRALNVYGAVFARNGFAWEGDCNGSSPCLNVWYNKAFSDARYAGVIPMVMIPGTWKTM